MTCVGAQRTRVCILGPQAAEILLLIKFRCFRQFYLELRISEPSAELITTIKGHVTLKYNRTAHAHLPGSWSKKSVDWQ